MAAALNAGSEDVRARDDCPAPDRIWSAVRLELSLAERLEVIDHIAECPACAEAWRMAVELGAGETSPATAFRGWTANIRWMVWPSVAAAAILLVLGIRFAGMPGARQPQVDPIVRDPITDTLLPRMTESASLPREQFWIRWSAGPSGARYDLLVTTPELEVIADARGLLDPEYRVAPERLKGLASGTRLLWRVVAHAADGGTVSSRTYEVSVR